MSKFDQFISSASLLLGEPRQPRNEVSLSVILGDPDTLPCLQLLRMDQQGEDGHQEAVPHVPDADNLQEQDNKQGEKLFV